MNETQSDQLLLKIDSLSSHTSIIATELYNIHKEMEKRDNYMCKKCKAIKDIKK